MEAWTLRKALLVVALVLASFAGGAAVNGPGLTWLKGLIGDRLHRGDAIPTLDVDDGPPVAVAGYPSGQESQTPGSKSCNQPTDEQRPECRAQRRSAVEQGGSSAALCRRQPESIEFASGGVNRRFGGA